MTRRFPIVRGTIERRLLVNFRVAPDTARTVLPPPFRPHLVGGYAVAGICLIRLREIRPPKVPRVFGTTSENAAHRIAVEWDEKGERHTGVFIPRRDTDRRLNVLLGGRFFPGVHHFATFDIDESGGRLRVSMRSQDGEAWVSVDGAVTNLLPGSSVFRSLDDAADFFRRGAIGYSPSRKAGAFEGLRLDASRWHLEPIDVRNVRSSFFEDERVFPRGTVEFDSAFVMRELEHEWHATPWRQENITCLEQKEAL